MTRGLTLTLNLRFFGFRKHLKKNYFNFEIELQDASYEYEVTELLICVQNLHSKAFVAFVT